MIRSWRNSDGNSFLPNFFQNFGCVFSRSNTLLDISQECLVRLMWNEKEVHRLNTGWNMWPWPLTSPVTLTFDFSRSNFKLAVSQELLSDWCETKRNSFTKNLSSWDFLAVVANYCFENYLHENTENLQQIYIQSVYLLGILVFGGLFLIIKKNSWRKFTSLLDFIVFK